MTERYNREQVALLIAECQSYAEVLRRLGKQPVGGNVTNLRRMCQRWEIDLSGITGQAHARGKRSERRLTPTERLVMGSPTDHRTAAVILRKALLEAGVAHECASCYNVGTWEGKSLVLEIDHIDGKYWNNQRSNLQFLCPNCHSQKSIAPVAKR